MFLSSENERMAEKGDKGMAIEIRDDKLVYFKIGFNTKKKKAQ